jgi:hypothetical protein
MHKRHSRSHDHHTHSLRRLLILVIIGVLIGFAGFNFSSFFGKSGVTGLASQKPESQLKVLYSDKLQGDLFVLGNLFQSENDNPWLFKNTKNLHLKPELTVVYATLFWSYSTENNIDKNDSMQPVSLLTPKNTYKISPDQDISSSAELGNFKSLVRQAEITDYLKLSGLGDYNLDSPPEINLSEIDFKWGLVVVYKDSQEAQSSVQILSGNHVFKISEKVDLINLENISQSKKSSDKLVIIGKTNTQSDTNIPASVYCGENKLSSQTKNSSLITDTGELYKNCYKNNKIKLSSKSEHFTQLIISKVTLENTI